MCTKIDFFLNIKMSNYLKNYSLHDLRMKLYFSPPKR
jgi:hypothetical protein